MTSQQTQCSATTYRPAEQRVELPQRGGFIVNSWRNRSACLPCCSCKHCLLPVRLAHARVAVPGAVPSGVARQPQHAGGLSAQGAEGVSLGGHQSQRTDRAQRGAPCHAVLTDRPPGTRLTSGGRCRRPGGLLGRDRGKTKGVNLGVRLKEAPVRARHRRHCHARTRAPCCCAARVVTSCRTASATATSDARLGSSDCGAVVALQWGVTTHAACVVSLVSMPDTPYGGGQVDVRVPRRGSHVDGEQAFPSRSAQGRLASHQAQGDCHCCAAALPGEPHAAQRQRQPGVDSPVAHLTGLHSPAPGHVAGHDTGVAACRPGRCCPGPGRPRGAGEGGGTGGRRGGRCW